ncbi:hypothetical protein ACF09H_32170 [Streptomyces sp. NPDC014983]|uniref:hypothetical protein n=1 Tax=Streptomyces sp. NPDC014983 TaxID=3364933 RepID=UPI0036FB69FB
MSDAIANSSSTVLPAEVDHETVRSALQRLSVVPTDGSNGLCRYPSQRDQCEDLLMSALASDEEIPALGAVAAAIRQGVTSGNGIPDSVSGLAGYTTDFSMVESPVCAIVRTSPQGQPVGTQHIVRLPESFRDSQWGETSAILLAFVHARRTGFGQAAFYTDAGTVIRRLHDLTLLRRHNPPEPVRSLLEHPVIRRVNDISAHWIPRGSTPAQITADHTARHASRNPTLALPDTIELALNTFLPPPGHETAH